MRASSALCVTVNESPKTLPSASVTEKPTVAVRGSPVALAAVAKVISPRRASGISVSPASASSAW